MTSIISSFRNFQPINEGVSNLLYHFTYLHNIAGILADNRFATSGAIATGADMSKNRNKFFYISTQRSKNSKLGYGGVHGKHGGRNACIVFDGVKLRQKFTGRPADYWGWSREKKPGMSSHDYYQLMTSPEMEDRIVTDKPYIEEVSQYIKEIHLCVTPDGRNEQEELQSIADDCADHHIELYVYTDAKDFSNQRKDKAVDVASLQFTQAKQEPYEPTRSDDERVMSFHVRVLVYALWSENSGVYYQLKKYFGGSVPEKYEEEYDKYCENPLYRYDEPDLVRYFANLENDLHNLRQHPYPLYRLIMQLLVDEMKKKKCRSLQHYIWKIAAMTWTIKREPKTPTTKHAPRDWKLPVKYILKLDDGERVGDWSKRMWNYCSVDDFWEALPAEWQTARGETVKGGKKGEDRPALNKKERYYMFELMDDEDATFKQVYNTLVKRIGRRKAEEVFKACGCIVEHEPYTPNDFWVKTIR